MIIGMACFTVGDLLIKLASKQLPLGQIMMALGIGCAIVYLAMLKQAGQKVVVRTYLLPSVLLRNTGEIVAATSMFMALAFSPFSTVTAIIQTLPLLLTLAAVLFLGEQVGIHRVAALIIGFIGVLIVIRPGMSGFNQYSLMAMLAVVGMAMRDIGARLTDSSVSSLMLSFFSAVTLIFTGAVMWLVSGGGKVPDLITTLYLIGLVAAASSGLMMVTQSVRIAEISVVAPFRYVRIIYGMGLGILVLGEVVDRYTMIGSLITISAGIYIWMRENRVRAAT
jgi:drug/metabolite transporter (DMT)-like permease